MVAVTGKAFYDYTFVSNPVPRTEISSAEPISEPREGIKKEA